MRTNSSQTHSVENIYKVRAQIQRMGSETAEFPCYTCIFPQYLATRLNCFLGLVEDALDFPLQFSPCPFSFAEPAASLLCHRHWHVLSLVKFGCSYNYMLSPKESKPKLAFSATQQHTSVLVFYFNLSISHVFHYQKLC